MKTGRISRHAVRFLALGLVAVGAGIASETPPITNPPPSVSIEAAEFAPRSGPRSGPLFTLMPAGTTGVVVENNYGDPKMWAERYQDLAYGEMGTGIAIGDYDGDGRPDIFVVSKSGQSRLFRNLGSWKFEDVTEKAGLRNVARAGSAGGDAAAANETAPWSQGAVFVDVNNDGRLDLYICRFGAPNLLYINQGDGTFRATSQRTPIPAPQRSNRQ